MEKIVQSNGTLEELAIEAARAPAEAIKGAQRAAKREPSMKELWALLKAKGLVSQDDLINLDENEESV